MIGSLPLTTLPLVTLARISVWNSNLSSIELTVKQIFKTKSIAMKYTHFKRSRSSGRLSMSATLDCLAKITRSLYEGQLITMNEIAISKV